MASRRSDQTNQHRAEYRPNWKPDSYEVRLLTEGRVKEWNQLRNTKPTLHPNLHGINLHGVDLKGVNLREANLEDAQLQGCNLTAADLSCGMLGYADLTEAVLVGANVSCRWATGARFTEANLEGASLEWSRLKNTDFQKANLSHTNLRDCYIFDSDWHQVCLVCADLKGSTLSHSRLQGADLTRAILTDTKLDNVSFKAAILVEACLKNARFTSREPYHHRIYSGSTDLRDAVLTNADLTGVTKLEPAHLALAKDVTGTKYDFGLNMPRVAPQVFLSYSWSDKGIVLAVDEWLRQAGARVILDERDFLVGENVREEIIRCIEGAGVVVCFVSRNSKDRPYPRLEREIAEHLRLKGQIHVIYFALDDTVLDIDHETRLLVNGHKLTFQEACIKLWTGITRQTSEL